ncbi:MAG: hypothetical protein RLZZ165_1303 [Bacteroidota bacterium]|jgi:membrane associated rhomboid family serine protease
MNDITKTIVEGPIATAIFLATIATSYAAFQNPLLKERFILRPYALVHRKQYFTVITSGFIHADWNHLLMNMFTFYFFAFRLEHDLMYLQSVHFGGDPSASAQRFAEILGHVKFFLIYFISMVVADLTMIVKYKDVPGYACLGASGAISGLVMSCIVLAPAMQNEIWIWGVLPGWLFAILYLSFSYYAARRRMDNVAHEAHLWGSIAGIVLTAALLPRESWKFIEMLQGTLYGWTG